MDLDLVRTAHESDDLARLLLDHGARRGWTVGQLMTNVAIAERLVQETVCDSEVEPVLASAKRADATLKLMQGHVDGGN